MMICPNCKEDMVPSLTEDEVKIYNCEKCDTYIETSVNYVVDCLSQEHGRVQHEVDFTDWRQANSVMKWISKSDQHIIGVSKKETQVKLEYVEVEDFIKFLSKNGIEV